MSHGLNIYCSMEYLKLSHRITCDELMCLELWGVAHNMDSNFKIRGRSMKVLSRCPQPKLTMVKPSLSIFG